MQTANIKSRPSLQLESLLDLYSSLPRWIVSQKSLFLDENLLQHRVTVATFSIYSSRQFLHAFSFQILYLICNNKSQIRKTLTFHRLFIGIILIQSVQYYFLK